MYLLRVVIVSGYFNPLHTGHLDYLESASKLGNYLVVIVNNDHQVKIKGSAPFMSLEDRLRIVGALACVGRAVASIDDDGSVVKTLRTLHESYSLERNLFSITFANGGDRKLDNIPEYSLCEELGICTAFNTGGKKTQSSSDIINKVVTND
jgi:D-beta-D-heptose 7-phosphate kinase/D-beta-D-heptose 1-phosphate adenosyltransferase